MRTIGYERWLMRRPARDLGPGTGIVAALLSAAMLVAGGGCGEEDLAPVVVIVSVSPDTLDPSRDDADDLTIVAEYRDADGDLGGGVVEIHDCRAAELVTVGDIPEIASEEAVRARVPIEGTLRLVVGDVGHVAIDAEPPPVCADLGVAAPVAGEATFCVRLTDLAGNTGPGDCTAPVTILAP
jgi:predicted secreted protein